MLAACLPSHRGRPGARRPGTSSSSYFGGSLFTCRSPLLPFQPISYSYIFFLFHIMYIKVRLVSEICKSIYAPYTFSVLGSGI
uniref:Uncharacterized protein n=1 Tax=Aegilops tauschii subsp. strangulata TaxID=200361 RepID=A0A453HLZ1_AEGTS